jgi:hypothetical protein
VCHHISIAVYPGSFPVVKQSVYEVVHSSLPSVEVKNLLACSFALPICHHGSYTFKSYLVIVTNVPMLINFTKGNFPLVIFTFGTVINLGHAVAQLVEALRYKPEGRGYDFR